VNRQLLIFLLGFSIFSYFIIGDINLPYVGPNATNFSVYSLIAHNFNHFGYFATKFAPVISIANTLPAQPEYFFHHPTLLSFIESLLFKILGEQFWVGRLTVILFAYGSLLLIFFIGRLLENKKFALLAFFVASLIPASTLFGKMIGQEPLVLFFCLLAFYYSFKFLKTNKNRFLVFSAFSLVFGILSDWPALFFIVFFFHLFRKYKKIKAWALLVAISVITASLLLFYIFIMRGGFWDLQNAATLRGVTGLLNIPFWPIRWLITTILRLLIYFNPLVIVLSFVSFYKVIKTKKLSNRDYALLGMFGFALFYMVVYTQAAFTHPYLVYYWLPFIAFGSACYLFHFLSYKKYIFLTFIFLFCFVYLVIIQTYKTKQIETNIWRYELAHKVSQYLSPYEYILNNGDTVIDADLLWYPHLINMKGTNESLNSALKTHMHYVYSCQTRCNSKEPTLQMLREKYTFIDIMHPQAEAYIFLLQQKKMKDTRVVLKDFQLAKNNKDEGLVYKYLKQSYRFAETTLHVPQF